MENDATGCPFWGILGFVLGACQSLRNADSFLTGLALLHGFVVPGSRYETSPLKDFVVDIVLYHRHYKEQ